MRATHGLEQPSVGSASAATNNDTYGYALPCMSRFLMNLCLDSDRVHRAPPCQPPLNAPRLPTSDLTQHQPRIIPHIWTPRFRHKMARHCSNESRRSLQRRPSSTSSRGSGQRPPWRCLRTTTAKCRARRPRRSCRGGRGSARRRTSASLGMRPRQGQAPRCRRTRGHLGR